MDFKGICVVEVSGNSCANCISLMPILNKIISSRDDCSLYHIEVDENMKTSVDGIYAAGDITGGVKQVIVAAGQAAQAVTHISELLLI